MEAGLGMKRSPNSSNLAQPISVRMASAIPPMYHPPTRHEPACHMDKATSPPMSAAAVVTPNRSCRPNFALHDNRDA